MTARAALQSLLEEDPELVALGLEAVYAANSVDTPDEEFFAVVSWGPATSAFGQTGTDRVSIWLYDKQRDYGRINAGLARLKDLILGTTQRLGADGSTLSVAEWNGESQDLFDTGYEAVTRYADFTVASR
jgi:hypothetical protein